MASCDIPLIPNSSSVSVENFMQGSAYREMIENSASYNSRLCVERKLRMPFLDTQTGVAQNHSNLFLSDRQRMPGLKDGQLYSYPSKRWRKKRRQYLINFLQPKKRENADVENCDNNTVNLYTNEISIINEDSKDSVGGSSTKDESVSKDPWFYDDEVPEIEPFEEPDADSDFDYEDTPKRRRRRTGKSSKNSIDTPTKRGSKGPGPGRGRRRGGNSNADFGADADKPYCCETCGARYKTRPGLTYHYNHSHKDKIQDDDGSLDAPPISPSPHREKYTTGTITATSPLSSTTMLISKSSLITAQSVESGIQSSTTWDKFKDTYTTYLGKTPGAGGPSSSSNIDFEEKNSYIRSCLLGLSVPSTSNISNTKTVEYDLKIQKKDDQKNTIPKKDYGNKKTVIPSTYCDFCLGSVECNKKTGHPEELVSCSDCGRSGHPTCLQFTANMKISVKNYKWQCIECKCCFECGLSDNDEQLLFCDDCDRGYHMYCLTPRISSPPEGLWSCRLCVAVYHKK